MKGINYMKITNICVKPIEGLPRLKGYARIIFDHQLAINEIKIIKSRNGMCIEFPKDKDLEKTRFESIAPLNWEIRDHIESLILKAYHIGGDYFCIEPAYIAKPATRGLKT
jgi:stage V sporulation protein G